MPPCFYADPSSRLIANSLAGFLSERLEGGEAVDVQLRGNIWEITTTVPTPADQFKKSLRVSWDLDQQAIVELLWFYALPGGEEHLRHARLKNKKVEGLWVPQEVFLVQYNKRVKKTIRWEFSNIELNRSLTESDFLISFPVGIRLTDHIDEKHFLTR